LVCFFCFFAFLILVLSVSAALAHDPGFVTFISVEVGAFAPVGAAVKDFEAFLVKFA
jgi:hypothetical protein